MESDGVYSLVFADKNLAGATYEITAAEDIITPDGTLRYAKDTVVDTVITDESRCISASIPSEKQKRLTVWC